MLDEYDRALIHANEQPVPTHHGIVGEASVRDWLGTFLPKKYGVTSGFIRNQGLPTPHQSAHFDVIIYDQVEAPILWIEANEDKSESGRKRIIPAEHVRAILEVKAAFSRRTVRDAIAKLGELTPLTAGANGAAERYPKYLPASAILAMVFFELRTADASDMEALNLLRTVEFGRPFYGAAVLRGQGIQADATAIVQRYQSDMPSSELLFESGLLHGIAMTASVKSGGTNVGAHMMWGDVNFSQFAFDLLALLNGTYRTGFLSSMHGVEIRGHLGKTQNKAGAPAS